MKVLRQTRGQIVCIATLLCIFVFFISTTLLRRSPNSRETASAHRKHSAASSSTTSDSRWPKPIGFPLPKPVYDVPPHSADDGWEFNVDRDQRNFTLTHEHCSAAFPNFFYEIDRALQYRKEQNLGPITAQEIDVGWRDNEIIRAMIYDNQLYIVEAKFQKNGQDLPRVLSLLHSMQRAIVSSPAIIPNIEFAFGLSDWPGDINHKYPLWVLTRFATGDYEKWVMPDFGYWSWPGIFMGEYTEIRRDILENEPKWEKKRPQAAWRGSTDTNKLRETLVDQSRGKKWSDVQPIHWDDPKGLDDIGLTASEHCDYQYLIHTEGHSYSGRAKYLLNCHSVSIVHTPEWIEPHTHLFKTDGPDQNVMAVNQNFSDLDTKMTYYTQHPSEAKAIADNSVAVFRDRYLTPAAQACYWRRLFTTWAKISFVPELYEEVVGHNGRKKKKTRGTTYETWVADPLFTHKNFIH